MTFANANQLKARPGQDDKINSQHDPLQMQYAFLINIVE